MHREWGQKLPVGVGRQSKLPQLKKITQAQEQPHVARRWQKEPTAMLTAFLLWWLDIGPCPISPLKYLRYFPWLLFPDDLLDTRLVPAPVSTKSQCSSTWPNRRYHYVGTCYKAISTEKSCRGRLTAMQGK